MAYIDTSVWVAALCREALTARVQTWLEKQPAGALHTSGWVQAEYASALALKQRTGQLDAAQAATAMTLFSAAAEHACRRVSVEEVDFALASRLVADPSSGLRAGDALHLAMAARQGLALVTLDSTLAKAAQRFGVQSRLLQEETA
ncbi:MAG TPA: VapC toxin family PIN domain ribonuclease [Xanthomonadaceae bacterium]|nr:VapC toxin family PIN domain ribonuclease [Xanthomonadaceae bacterium]